MLYRFAARPARRWLSPLLLGLLMAPSVQATTVSQEPALSDRQTLVKGNGAEPESLDPAQIRSGFPGEVVLVFGAAGGVGTYAVQLVRTEQMFDPLLPSPSAHGAALPELWQALRELFPVFVLRG